MSERYPHSDGSRQPVPVTMTVDILAVAARHEYEAGETWDRLHEVLDAAGFVCEGGSSTLMDEADVIPDGPLDVMLKEARRA